MYICTLHVHENHVLSKLAQRKHITTHVYPKYKIQTQTYAVYIIYFIYNIYIYIFKTTKTYMHVEIATED